MTTGIIPNNNTSWYDPNIQALDEIIVSQINYDGVGTEDSATKTQVRLMQDSGRRQFPNCIRQGLGLSTSGNNILIERGDAVIAGRWAWSDAQDSIDCTGLEVGTSADYYVIWRVELIGGGKPTENATRDPQDEISKFVVDTVSGYTPDNFELVLGKVNINDQTPTFANATDKYTDIPDQWATGRIVPRSKSADGQNSYSNVRIAYSTGGVEVIDMASSESFGFRIWKQLRLDDQSGGSSHARLKANAGDIQARDAGDSTYTPIDASSYKIDGTVVINNSRQISNVTLLAGSTVNGFTLAGDIVSTANRSIDMQDAADLTFFIKNTLAGLANLDVDGTITSQNGQSSFDEVVLTTPLDLTEGGTGAVDAGGARSNLGLGALATKSTINNSDWSGTDLSIGNGGTGASSVGGAQSNLGLVPGTDIQPYSDTLAEMAAVSPGVSDIIYWVDATTTATTTITSLGRDLISSSNQADARADIDAAASSHTHSMTDLNIEEQTTIIRSNLIDLGAGTSLSSEDIWGVSITFNGNGDEINIHVPYIIGKTLTQVKLRCKAAGNSFDIQPISRWDGGLSSGFGSPAVENIGSTYETLNWSGSASFTETYKMLNIRIRRAATGSATLDMQSITMVYS